MDSHTYPEPATPPQVTPPSPNAPPPGDPAAAMQPHLDVIWSVDIGDIELGVTFDPSGQSDGL